MLSVDEMIERLRTRNLSIVARDIGVSYLALWAFAKERRKHVSLEMLQKLSEYLEVNK